MSGGPMVDARGERVLDRAGKATRSGRPALSGVAPIRTERLWLRAFEPRDLPDYLAYRTGGRTDGVGGPLNADEAARRFAEMAGHWLVHGFGRYAMCEEMEAPAIGHVGPLARGVDAGPPEMTWTLWSEAVTGRGYATEAARAVLGSLRGRWPALPVYVRPANAASHRVAERLGAVLDPDGPANPYMPDAVIYRLELGS